MYFNAGRIAWPEAGVQQPVTGEAQGGRDFLSGVKAGVVRRHFQAARGVLAHSCGVGWARKVEAERWLHESLAGGRSFFVEVGVNDGQGQAVVLRSFVNCGPLADYAHGVYLPEYLFPWAK